MSIERQHISISGLQVEVVRKNIKNLHLGVYPPSGRVRVAVPLRVTNDSVRLAIIGKLGWIKRQRSKFESQARQSEREMVSGESHFFLGRRYRLRVVNHEAPAKVVIRSNTVLELHVRQELDAQHREQVLQRWYRQQLKKLAPKLIDKWQSKLGVQAADWRIKKMKTKWGTCNIDAKRIWLNLELIKKPVRCLEYIIAHELTHLIERHHNDNFVGIMDKHMPQWRTNRLLLNSAPLAYEAWGY